MFGPDVDYDNEYEDEDYEDGDEEDDDDDYGDEPDYDDENYLIDGVGFADPSGRSALRATTKDNPRNQPCPSCGSSNRLTPIDVSRGYQCDPCADRDEGHYGSVGYGDY